MYLGINPHKNLKRFTEVKPKSSYPQAALDNIKLLTFGRDKTAEPFGSYIYRIQKYPGDLDLVEEFTECCNVDDVVNQFEKALQRVVKEINKKRLHYFSEVKAGLDFRYEIDIGNMQNGFYYPNPELSKISNDMFNEKLITEEENKILQYILSQKNPLDADAFDTITFIFREHRILRWSDEEILKGIKQLPNKKSITLNEALRHRTHIKIDMITELGGRLVEITNFFQLAYEEEGEIHTINIDLEENHNIPVQMPKEIEKLYFSDTFYSPFKMVKRMYSLGRHNLDQELLYKIIPFVSSNTSLLYQIKSEIDTIILVLERLKSYPKKLIEKQLNDAKLRISTILELPQDDLLTINNLIDKINMINKKEEKRLVLKDLKKYIVRHINIQTIQYLEKVGLNPPPVKYLPPILTYNVTHIRGPGEDPENPYKKYVAIIENMNQGSGYNVYYPTSNHYPNFFVDPESSRYLSQKIISNPGLNDIPLEDQRNFEPSRFEPLPRKYNEKGEIIGEGDQRHVIGFWASFVKKYRKDHQKNPPIDYCYFRSLFMHNKKYNYERMLTRIIESLKYGRHYENYPEQNIQEPEMSIPEVELRRPELSIPPPPPINIPIPPPPPGLTTEEKEEMKRRKEEARKKQEETKKIPAKSPRELMMEELLKKIKRPEGEGFHIPSIFEGKGGEGSMYAHNYRMPLYMNQNLKLPKFLTSNMTEAPLTGSSFASDYYHRGYGPSLKPIYINNAPLVMNGKIVDYHRAGCDSCGLKEFRKSNYIN